MLTQAEQSALVNAVPSFETERHQWLAMHAEYVRQYPAAAFSPEQDTHEFLGHLASHLGMRVAAGDLHEAEWLFVALEDVYRRADSDLEVHLTIGFMESFIYAIEGAGVAAAILHPLAKGPLVERAWRRAFDYTHQPPPRDSRAR